MKDFTCDKCGLCCQNLDLSDMYSDLDDGTGTCIFFDKETRLCTIYNNRPIKCNVKKSYQFFKDKMSYDDYVLFNMQMCELLKNKHLQSMKEE